MKKEMGVLELVVVGAGALGNAVVEILGSRQVRRVLIVDADVVEAKNLPLALFFGRHDVGQPKAAALARSAGDRFPRIVWEAFVGEIADLGWGRLEGRSVLLGCVDRDSARLEMARIGTRLGLPICDGGLGAAGRASYFPSRRDQACFSCRLTAVRRRELLSTWRSHAHPCREPVGETALVATLEQAAATARLQVALAFEGGAARTLEIRPPEISRFDMSVSAGCPFHAPPVPLVPLPRPLPPGLVYGWEWPICLHASCRDCAHDWWPFTRRARLRLCPRCGSERIVAHECVAEIDAHSRWADLPPSRIGLPEGHRYTVREMRMKPI